MDEAVEETDEIDQLLKGKKKKKHERSMEESRRIVEQFLAKMEAAAEQDFEAVQQATPAIYKLKMLPEVENVMSQQNLHEDFLSGGLLGTLKAWLELTPDGNLPNIKVRSYVLKLLNQLPINVLDNMEMLKSSGIGTLVLFLSKLPDELKTNRKAATELVQKWSRPIFEQYKQDQHNQDDYDQERRASAGAARKGSQAADEDADAAKKGETIRWHARIPEAARLDYSKRPTSKARVDDKGPKKDASKGKVFKKLKTLDRKGKVERAAKVSVEGRNVVTYS